MCYIICPPEAGASIKALSPDLITVPILYDGLTELDKNTLCMTLERSHAIVIGPGLSRSTLLLEIAAKLANECIALNKPIVIDGDGIHLLKKHSDLCSYEKLFVTPNHHEFERLMQQLELQKTFDKDSFSGYIISKGPSDRIFHNDINVSVSCEGNPKRVAGQGDILAGVLACFLSWIRKAEHLSNDETVYYFLAASLAACRVIRKAAFLAFRNLGFSLLGSDIIPMIEAACKEMGIH